MESDQARELSAGVLIRHLGSHDDYHACLRLQRDVWGADFHDCVGPALLKVAQRIGGLAVGAFEGDELVGFVFGMRGVLDGEPVHWSHMLAVAPRARSGGIGRQLKQYQRKEVADAGMRAMAWTFDPLVARNAHLNLNVLGVDVAEYVERMYPATESKLHGSLPTDRLVVRWNLDDSSPVGAPGAGEAAGEVEPGAGAGAPHTADWRREEGRSADDEAPPNATEIRILIPADFEELLLSAPSAARDARRRTRDFFLRFLGASWKVVGFRRPPGESPYYLLRRGGE